MILLALGSRIAWVEALLLAFFLHACLTAQRHVTLLVIVAVPIVARELVRGLEQVQPEVGRLLARVHEPHPQRLAVFLYYATICIAFLALAGRGALPYRSDFDDIELSAAAASYIEEHPRQFARTPAKARSKSASSSMPHGFLPPISQVTLMPRSPALV